MTSIGQYLRPCRRRARDERGIILPIALLVMFVILMLTIPVVDSAVQSNKFANRQILANEALATAEAGAQTAYHRLRAYVASGSKLEAGSCFTTTAVATESGGLCPGQTDTFGAHKYTYYVAPLNSSAYNCTGGKVNGEVIQRCITSTATVGGVKARVQERVAGQVTRVEGTGLRSLGEIIFTNSATITGTLIANERIETHNGVKITGEITGSPIKLGEASSCVEPACKKFEKSGTVGSKTPSVAPGPYEEAAKGSNNKAVGSVLETSYGFVSATRVWHYGNPVGTKAAPVQLASGVYDFCEIELNQEAWLEVPKGNEVTIYIDSPEREKSGCSGHGDFKATNGMCLLNPSGKMSAVKINMWGTPKGNSEFGFTNGLNGCSQALVAEVYAPYSKFITTNGANLQASVLAEKIEATGTITVGGGGSGGSESTENYAPSAWTICPPSPSESDPSSGCYH